MTMHTETWRRDKGNTKAKCTCTCRYFGWNWEKLPAEYMQIDEVCAHMLRKWHSHSRNGHTWHEP